MKLPFIKVKNSPQIAVWIEDGQGNYLETLYVTKRVAKQAWRKAPGDPADKEEIRRKSALPYWAHKRGVKYEDGSYLPTKEEPLPDVVTSATPDQSFNLVSTVDQKINKFVVKVESLQDKLKICEELTEIVLEPVGGPWRKDEIIAFSRENVTDNLMEKGEQLFFKLFKED